MSFFFQSIMVEHVTDLARGELDSTVLKTAGQPFRGVVGEEYLLPQDFDDLGRRDSGG